MIAASDIRHLASRADSPSKIAGGSLRTGKELILATKPYAADFPGRSWWHVLSSGLLLAAALAGTIWVGGWTGKIICSFLAGLFILRCFVIYHDQQHQAILSQSRVAAGLMRVFGILVLSPSSIWQSSHNHHHAHNSKLRGSHIGSFPIMTKAQYLQSSTARRLGYLFTRHPLTIACGYPIVFLYGMCLAPFASSPTEHRDCLLAFVVHGGIAVALVGFLGWPALVLTQVLPHFIASAIGTYLFYAQHNFPGVSFNDKAGWTYEKAALESSSYIKTGPLWGWFTANIGYHHIHHLNPRIPFYRLPEVFAEIPELSTPKTTSLRPPDIVRCLRLKVWDVAAQQMVSLRKL